MRPCHGFSWAFASIKTIDNNNMQKKWTTYCVLVPHSFIRSTLVRSNVSNWRSKKKYCCQATVHQLLCPLLYHHPSTHHPSLTSIYGTCVGLHLSIIIDWQIVPCQNENQTFNSDWPKTAGQRCRAIDLDKQLSNNGSQRMIWWLSSCVAFGGWSVWW